MRKDVFFSDHCTYLLTAVAMDIQFKEEYILRNTNEQFDM